MNGNGVEQLSVDDTPVESFGDLDYDLDTQGFDQSQLPEWLEGAEDIALLEADSEEVTDELLSLATLDQGTADLSQTELDTIRTEVAVAKGQRPPNGNAWLAIGLLAGLLVLAGAAKGRVGRRGW